MSEPMQNTNTAAPIRVLAIDDKEEFRELVKEFLTPFGFEVTLAANPVKALELFQREKDRFDLVLLDYLMPQMDGAKTFEWLRKLNPKIKVIVVSGAEPLRLRQLQAQTPIDGFLHKPFNWEEAAAYIKRIMAQPPRV
jgi:CheY-like chemotaxis protein